MNEVIAKLLANLALMLIELARLLISKHKGGGLQKTYLQEGRSAPLKDKKCKKK